MLFTIINTTSGANLGSYVADTEAEALNAMARDAGYTDYAEAEEIAPTADGEIVVSFGADRTLWLFDEGAIDYDTALRILQNEGWTERRAAVILDEHIAD